jgi:hypothetical protein
MSKEFTVNDVKEAGSLEKGLHIIIDNDVYEMGGFVDEHPGGAKILKRVGGKDASKQFWKVSEARTLYGIGGTWLHYKMLRLWCDTSVSSSDRNVGILSLPMATLSSNRRLHHPGLWQDLALMDGC